MSDEPTKLKQQLEQLLAQDLSEMGYEARICRKQRIDALKLECAADSSTEAATTITAPPQSNVEENA